MEKALYIILNKNEEYFVKIETNNSIVFQKDRNYATKMEWEEANDLVSFIEFKTRQICIVEHYR